MNTKEQSIKSLSLLCSTMPHHSMEVEPRPKIPTFPANVLSVSLKCPFCRSVIDIPAVSSDQLPKKGKSNLDSNFGSKSQTIHSPRNVESLVRGRGFLEMAYPAGGPPKPWRRRMELCTKQTRSAPKSQVLPVPKCWKFGSRTRLPRWGDTLAGLSRRGETKSPDQNLNISQCHFFVTLE
ncbi:MAG: hypothetical protein JWM04_2612 [Verrucomicrobiales bacterium]|nr:hypothetical protein [Verrucomicrobiales bacterium]